MCQVICGNNEDPQRLREKLPKTVLKGDVKIDPYDNLLAVMPKLKGEAVVITRDGRNAMSDGTFNLIRMAANKVTVITNPL